MKNLFLFFTILTISTSLLKSQVWEFCNKGLDFSYQSFFGIDIDPYNENTMIVFNSNRLFISFDSGDEWHRLGLPDSDNYIWHAKINNGIIYLSVDSPNSTLYITSDTGKSYQIVKFYYREPIFGKIRDNFYINDFTFSENYVYIASDGGAYKLANGWMAWEHITDTLLTKYVSEPPSCWRIVALDSLIFICSYVNGIHYSSNSGISWEKRNNGLKSSLGVRIYPESIDSFNNVLFTFLSSPANGTIPLYVSYNNGNYWEEFLAPKQSTTRPNIKSYKNTLFMRIDDMIYFTSDFGKHWDSFKKDSIFFSYQLTCWGMNSKYFFISKKYDPDIGLSSGLFRAKWNDGVFEDGTSINIPPDLSEDISISPNPASDYIEISVRAQRAVPEDIAIYDVLGIEAQKSMDSRFRGNDSHFPEASSVRIDVSQLPPGVYFIRAGDVVRKFIKI